MNRKFGKMFPDEYWNIVIYFDDVLKIETVCDVYFSEDVAISIAQLLVRKFIIDGLSFKCVRVFHLVSNKFECHGDLVLTIDPKHLRS